MNRRCRIAFELLGPPPLGLLVLVVAWQVGELPAGSASVTSKPDLIKAAGYATVIAYILAGIPSLLYAVMMERGFRAEMDPKSWRSVRKSTLLGTAAGAVIAAFCAVDLKIFLWLTGSGGMVGFLMGWAIRRLSTESARPSVAMGRRIATIIGLIGLPVLAWSITYRAPPWVAMWAIALAEFLTLKIFTLCEAGGNLRVWRSIAYLTLWPGLNASDFLHSGSPRPEWTRWRVVAGALANMALGTSLLWWALRHVAISRAWLVGWVGMAGLIFLLHFGAFRFVAWVWCRAGVDAPPIMRNPVAATSLAEFWGARWNVAFAETARRFVFRPLARRAGAKAAGAVVFLLSGLIHESVISLPAGGGWGGPTLYFALQAAGIAAEKNAAGRRFGLGSGWRGRLWTLGVTAAPVPLLFHAPFVGRVIVPLLHEITLLLP